MNQDTLAAMQNELQEKRKILAERVQRTAKHLYRRDEPYSADFAEQAVEVENNQVVEYLDDEAKAELAQIDKALLRLENGEYGICSNCQGEINEARLKAIPFSLLCIDCAEKQH
ncbi:MAG: TraR/DksA family transcriptional regulator [Pseudomonadales bacterium]